MGSTPNNSIRLGETVYFIESCRRVREAVVCGRSGPLFTLRFTDTAGGVRLRPDRLYPTREAAEATLRQNKEARKTIQPPSALWHNVPLWQC